MMNNTSRPQDEQPPEAQKPEPQEAQAQENQNPIDASTEHEYTNQDAPGTHK
jgi:hypothetical protein